MLPEEYYNDACKLFCIWLSRLEERDRRIAAKWKDLKKTAADNNRESGTPHRLSLPNLSASQHTRAD